MTSAPVELHVVSDATGETAARLVQALEAQFPDQEFVEIRHPRIESEEDLHLAVNRDEGTARGRGLHDRAARAPRCDAHALPAREAPLLRPPRPSDRGRRARLRHGGEDDAGLAAAARTRRTSSGWRRSSSRCASTTASGAASRTRTSCSSASRARRRRRSRSTSAISGTRRRTCRSCKGIEPPPELFEIDQRKIVGLTINAEPARRDPARARPHDGRPQPAVRRADGDLRRARAGGRSSTGGSAAP